MRKHSCIRGAFLYMVNRMVNEFDRIFEQNEKERQRKKLICELVAEDMYVPMKEKELAAFMQVPREEKEEFRRILQALVAEGRLQVTAQGRYGKPDDNRLVGIYTGTARGFGFVEVEGREDDLYIPEDKRGGAFHQDRVQVMLLPGRQGKRQEACVVQVLERGLKQVVGTWEQCGNFGFVIPDNSRLGTDIFVPQERSRGAVTGHKVVVELVSYGDEKHKPEGAGDVGDAPAGPVEVDRAGVFVINLHPVGDLVQGPGQEIGPVVLPLEEQPAPALGDRKSVV